MTTLHYAKALRSGMTDAEQRLWYHLRAHRFLGLKFRRQKPMGPYIADFVCIEKMLVIEVDGSQHTEAFAYDSARDAWFAAQGYKVLRFWNNEVFEQLAGVLEKIRLTIEGWQRPLPLAPLLQAGEGSLLALSCARITSGASTACPPNLPVPCHNSLASAASARCSSPSSAALSTTTCSRMR